MTSSRTLSVLVVLATLHFTLCSIAAAQYPTEWDSANYCIGVVRYDLHQHSPHPPGYPLYTFAGWILNLLMGDPHRSLTIMSRLLAAASVFPIHALARRFVGSHDALVVAGLAVLNPLSLFYGSVALSTISGLFWGPMVVLLACEALKGVPLRMTGASIALGLAGGFRQDLLVFLLLPWALSLLLGTASWGKKLASSLVLLAVVSAWLLPMVMLTGGPAEYLEVCGAVTQFASEGSIALEGSVREFLRNFIRFCAAILIGTSGVGLVAGALLARRSSRSVFAAFGREKYLLAAWIAPPTLFFLLFFIHKPGYILPVLPGLLVFAILLLRRFDRREGTRLGLVNLTSALSAATGLVFFLVCPSVGRFSTDENGYLVSHERLPPGLRLMRQFSRVSMDEIALQDERVHEVNRQIRGLLEKEGEIAIVTVPGDAYGFRIAMCEWPDLPVFDVKIVGGAVIGVARGYAHAYEMLEPAPGDAVVLGPPDGGLVWMSSSDSELGGFLEEHGAARLEGASGTRLWLGTGGVQPLSWSR